MGQGLTCEYVGGGRSYTTNSISLIVYLFKGNIRLLSLENDHFI